MNELYVSRRNFSPATKMLDQAPAPSPCVSPRPDTLLTHLVSRARGGPRFVNATTSRRPWRTALLPPSRLQNLLGSRLWRPTNTLRSLVEITRRMPPRFQHQSHATPSLQHSSHDDQSPEQQPQPEPRPSPPHLTPRRLLDVGWGGGAALVPAAPLPPYRGPEIPPSLSSAVAPSEIAWPKGGGCPVGLGGGVRVDGPRPWPRGRLRGWGLGVRVGGEGWGW